MAALCTWKHDRIFPLWLTIVLHRGRGSCVVHNQILFVPSNFIERTIQIVINRIMINAEESSWCTYQSYTWYLSYCYLCIVWLHAHLQFSVKSTYSWPSWPYGDASSWPDGGSELASLPPRSPDLGGSVIIFGRYSGARMWDIWNLEGRV